jgi:hypothetical protein
MASLMSTPNVAFKPPAVGATAPAKPAPVAAPAAAVPSPGVTPTQPVVATQATSGNAKRRFPYPNILVLGESGTGKTRSMINMPWASGEVALVDTEDKGAPWMEVIPESCIFRPRTVGETMSAILNIEMNPKFKYAILDSFTRFGAFSQMESKEKYTGYEIYRASNDNLYKLLERLTSRTKRWIVMAIPELITPGTEANTTSLALKRARVPGQELTGCVEAYFAYSTYLKVTPVPNGKAQHQFSLVADLLTQAKIPENVKETVMPNDLWKFIQLVEAAERETLAQR